MNRTSRFRSPRAVAGVCAVLAVAALTACTGSDGDDLGEHALTADELEAADVLVTAYNEVRRMQDELSDVEARILELCMEDRGFHVHDPTMIQHRYSDATEAEDFGHDGPANQIPSTDEAVAVAFEVWLERSESAQEHPDGGRGDRPGTYDNPRFAAWEGLAQDEQRAWTAAFMGEEKTAATYADTDQDEDRLPYNELPYGGCIATMADAVYGGVEWREVEPGHETWVWGVQAPPLHNGREDRERRYKSLVAESEQHLEECVAERGYPGWELNDSGWFNVRAFFTDLYYPDGRYGYADRWLTGIPTIDPVPIEYEVIKELEFKMAADFAACADGSGWREESHRVYRDLRSAEMLDMEVELFAWHEALSEALANAQGHLANEGY